MLLVRRLDRYRGWRTPGFARRGRCGNARRRGLHRSPLRRLTQARVLLIDRSRFATAIRALSHVFPHKRDRIRIRDDGRIVVLMRRRGMLAVLSVVIAGSIGGYALARSSSIPKASEGWSSYAPLASAGHSSSLLRPDRSRSAPPRPRAKAASLAPQATQPVTNAVPTLGQLLAHFAVLRRPQTAADRSWGEGDIGPYWRPLNGLTRLAATSSNGDRVFLTVDQFRGPAPHGHVAAVPKVGSSSMSVSVVDKQGNDSSGAPPTTRTSATRSSPSRLACPSPCRRGFGTRTSRPSAELRSGRAWFPTA